MHGANELLVNNSQMILEESKENQGIITKPNNETCSCGSEAEILMIDDDGFNHMALQLILGNQFIPDFAYDGIEGIEMVKKRYLCRSHQEFKMVLIDMNMPGINGYETTF